MSAKLPFNTSHAFIIGNDTYEHVSKLKTAVKDAKDIANLLGNVHQYTIHSLYNGTKEQMEDLFASMSNIVKKDDRVIFYFAGHGIAIDSEKDPEGYLVPVDAESKGIEKLVPMKLLHDTLLQLPCKHGLLILDCCFAGSFKWSTGFRFSFIRGAEEELYEERFMRFVEHPAWQVITSSASDQKALDGIQPDNLGARSTMTDKKNSPFAFALQQAIKLKGKAKQARGNRSDGVITATELYSYVRRMVEDESKKQGTKQSPAIFTLSKHDTKGEFIFLEPGHRLNLPKAPDQNPYQGLKAYKTQEQHSKMFFGREQAIAAMARQIGKTAILLVSAPSGQGKSSTVMAGLIPALQQKIQDQKGEYLMLRPSDQESKKWAKLDQLNVEEPHLILLDQYEEMFHQEEADRSQKETLLVAFYEKLQAYMQQHRKLPATKLILTMRSDFEWQLKQSAFGQAFWEEKHVLRFLYRLPPMEREELREAMVQPAYLVAYDFESDELIGRILDEVQHAPGALPLLSFTLQKLYEYRDFGKRLFTEKAYFDKLGGVNGALSTHADRVYKSLKDSDQQDFMRKLMLRMVRLNDGSYSRRKVYRTYDSKRLDKALDELDYPDHQDPTVEAVLKVMEETQLIVIGKDEVGTYVEPIHDSLINFWPRCLNWIQAFRRENIVLQRQIWQAVLEYHQLEESEERDIEDAIGKRPSSLWNNNPKLQQIQIAVTDPGYEWLVERELEDRPISSLSYLLWEETPSDQQLAILENWDWHFQQSDLQQRYEVVLAQMDNWLNEAEVAFVKESFARQQTELERAIKQRDEAIQARELAEKRTKEAEAAAITAIARTTPRENLTTRLKLMQAAYAKTLPDPPQPMVSQTLADVCFDQLQRDGKPPVYLPSHYLWLDSKVDELILTPDGKHILTFYSEREDSVWEDPKSSAALWSTKGSLIKEWTWESKIRGDVRCSPNGKYLVLFDELIMWNSEKQGFQNHPFSGGVYIRYGVDNDWFFSSNIDAIPGDSLFSIDNRYVLIAGTYYPRGFPVKELFRIDGQKIEGVPYPLWKGEERDTFPLVVGLEFSPDCQSLLCLEYDPTDEWGDEQMHFHFRIWNISEQKVISLVSIEAEDVDILSNCQVKFSPDGQSILVLIPSAEVSLWDRKGVKVADLGTALNDRIYSMVLFSPRGAWILTRPATNMISLWSKQGVKEKEITLGVDDNIEEAVFSPDDQKLILVIESTSLDEDSGTEDKRHQLLVYHLAEEIEKMEIPIDITAWKRTIDFFKDSNHFLLQNDQTTNFLDVSGHFIRQLEISQYEDPVYRVKGDLLFHIISDGSGVIAVNHNQQIQYLSPGGELISMLDNHNKKVIDLKVSDNEETIAVLSDDGYIKIWRKPFQGRKVFSFLKTSHKLKFEDANLKHREVEWSLNGQCLLCKAFNRDNHTYERDYIVHLWDQEWKHIHSFPHAQEATFSPDGQRILLTYEEKVELWDSNGDFISLFDPKPEQIHFIPNQKELFLVLKKEEGIGTASIWSENGEKLKDLEPAFPLNYDTKIGFSPDGQSFLTKGMPTTIDEFIYSKGILWMEKGDRMTELPWEPELRSGKDSSVFSPNGKYLFTFMKDVGNSLWDHEGTSLKEFERGDGRTYVEFSPSSSHLLLYSGGGACEIIALDGLHSIDLTETLKGDSERFKEYPLKEGLTKFSPDGDLFTITYEGDDEITTFLFDLDGTIRKELDQINIECVEFSPNAQWIVTVSWNMGQRSVMVIRDAKGSEIQVVEKAESRIHDVKWFPSSHLFLSEYQDQLKLWNTKGELLANWELGEGRYLGISPDGQGVLVSGENGAIQMWPIPEVWYQYLEETTDIPELTDQEKEDLGLNF